MKCSIFTALIQNIDSGCAHYQCFEQNIKKYKQFRMKCSIFTAENIIVFSVFAQNIDWSYTSEPNRLAEVVLTSTHNLCFEKTKTKQNKTKKNVYPFIPQFRYIKLGVKVGIHYESTLFPDGWLTVCMIFKPIYREHDICFNNTEYCIDACVGGVEAMILETCQISLILCDNTSSKCKCPNAAIMSARLFTNEFKLKINAIKH